MSRSFERIRQSVNWGGKGKHVKSLVVLAFLLSMAAPFMTVPGPVSADNEPPRADPELLRLAREHPDDIFRIIVQRDSKKKDLPDASPEESVIAARGKVRKHLNLIGSFSAELTGKEIVKLAKHKKVRWLSFDAPLFSTGTLAFSVIDRFNFPGSYNGNDGTYNWSTPWQEIGETDGADTGVVTVASGSMCASANNCLRFGGSGTLNYEGHGVSREVNLSEAPAATLSFNYRRGSAMGMGGSISVQVSGDGGATWANLGTLMLSSSDSKQKTLTVDISAYRAVNTQVRFIGSGWSSRSIYIDNILVSYEVSTKLLKAPTTERLYDTIAGNKYDGNDGTKNWSTPWIDNDAGGPGPIKGNVQAFAGTACWGSTGNCLQVYTANAGDQISRIADLSTAASATLTLWRNSQMPNQNNNQVTLEASRDGSSWSVLRTWRDIAADQGTANESFDLTPFIGPATQIRFKVAARGNSSYIYFDNILIEYTTLQNVYPAALRADKIWKQPPYLDGQGVTVAVVDSGFAGNADFDVYGGGGTRVIASADMVATPPDATDLYGHGTHVGGIIGGNGNQSNGARTGIAPGASLINVKVADSRGMSYASDLLEGLQWIYDNRAAYNIKVVNISMNSAVAESYHTSPIDAAVEILWFNGIVVVVSAGNNGGSGALFPPANDPFVITVGATDDMGTANINDDTVASFSAYGTTEDGFAKPDIVAPGRNIYSLLASTDSRLYTEHPDNRIDTYIFRMSGTSMSAPMVSGAVALLLQDEPNLNPDQVKYRLMSTANHSWSGYNATTAGAGYLDAFAAVKGTTTQTANTGLTASELLWNGSDPVNWSSVQWGSVQWGSVQWGSVQWGSVQWGTDYWGP